jgi:large subunit ribosomal protein L32
MAVPKKRQSSARRDKRRAHDARSAPRLNECPQCHQPRMPHRVCPNCGTYAGREVVSLDTPSLDPTGGPEGR